MNTKTKKKKKNVIKSESTPLAGYTTEPVTQYRLKKNNKMKKILDKQFEDATISCNNIINSTEEALLKGKHPFCKYIKNKLKKKEKLSTLDLQWLSWLNRIKAKSNESQSFSS